ncbi:hypothetical protein CspHIS471_0604980 [Cutaneotrichosporon sp. HIS471]|nr:hypothetical protein CspHIS471_0604980 [Cutaneotrichosporon sp. HIS471]
MQYHNEKAPAAGGPEYDLTPTALQPSGTGKGKRGSRYLNLKRLPTLQEVLDRRTRAPLDLFCFYIFLQRESSEDALDFWLDVQQHENLCKAYFKDLKRSGRSVDDDWPEFATYVRENGSYMAPLLDLASRETLPAARRSSELQRSSHPGVGTSKDAEHAYHEAHRQSTPSLRGTGRGRAGSIHSTRSAIENVRGSIRDWGKGRHSQLRAPTIFSRDRAIEKNALAESAERIYLRYLLPGAEHEIYLPPALRLTNVPVSTDGKISPLIPDLFHAQKIYIFRALEQDAFPRFLRAKAFGNLTPTSALLRLIVGLVILWGAFTLSFTFVFLDWSPNARRLYIIIPYFFAFNLLVAAYYSLSPLLALFSQSETVPFRFITVGEGYVRKLLLLRGLWIEALAILLTAIFTIIFSLVPGHRL